MVTELSSSLSKLSSISPPTKKLSSASSTLLLAALLLLLLLLDDEVTDILLKELTPLLVFGTYVGE
jgi:hypothetical protein